LAGQKVVYQPENLSVKAIGQAVGDFKKEASRTRVIVAQKARHIARLAQVPGFAKGACSE
jgi:hypothetical protein